MEVLIECRVGAERGASCRTQSSQLHEHEAVHIYDKYYVLIGGLGSGCYRYCGSKNSTPACAGYLLHYIDH